MQIAIRNEVIGELLFLYCRMFTLAYLLVLCNAHLHWTRTLSGADGSQTSGRGNRTVTDGRTIDL